MATKFSDLIFRFLCECKPALFALNNWRVMWTLSRAFASFSCPPISLNIFVARTLSTDFVDLTLTSGDAIFR